MYDPSSFASAEEIIRFITCPGSSQDKLAFLKGYEGRSEVFDLGYSELATVVNYVAAFGVPEENFEVDLTIARGLDYYTGTVYETVLTDHPEVGSVCSGGRYDNLAEYYTDKQLPGVGISIGLTRLFFVLEDKKMLNDDMNTSPADVLILPMGDDVGYVIETATRLRDEGIRVQTYFEKKKFKAKMNYADKLGVPFVLFVGEDEIASDSVSIKDMKSGAQEKVARTDAALYIKEKIKSANVGKPICEPNR